MASANTEVKEIKLSLKPQELSMIVDALLENLEDMENVNDDFSQVTLNVDGKLPFYKVEKQSNPHIREWFIKYNRLYRQLSRVNNNILKLRERGYTE
jgi:hypothetical protein